MKEEGRGDAVTGRHGDSRLTKQSIRFILRVSPRHRVSASSPLRVFTFFILHPSILFIDHLNAPHMAATFKRSFQPYAHNFKRLLLRHHPLT